jgi:chromosome segregation ATPase
MNLQAVFENLQNKKEVEQDDRFKRMAFEYLTSDEAPSAFARRVWYLSAEDCVKKHNYAIDRLKIDNTEMRRAAERSTLAFVDERNKNTSLNEKVKSLHESLVNLENQWIEDHNYQAERFEACHQDRAIWIERCRKLEVEMNAKNKDLSTTNEKLQRDLKDLGETLQYREQLNLSLSKKLAAAYKERNQLQETLDKQEYLAESIDAMERIINKCLEDENSEQLKVNGDE